MITLRLYDVDSTQGVLDLLYNNGYKYKNIPSLSLDVIKNDIINIFKFPNNDKRGHSIYFIEIDEKNKEFGLHSKWVDINYIRGEKLKQLNLCK